MTATFRVHDGFELPSRRAYILRGAIIEGVVRPGMFVEVPLNSGVTITAPILAVEAVDGPGRASASGLVFACEDQIDVAMWTGLTLPGELIHVTDHDPAA